MIIQKSNIGNVNRIDKSSQNTNINIPNGKTSFNDILSKELSKNEGIKFSKHAELRLATRNINLTKEQTQRLETAVKKAQEKGIKETLVMMDDLAFVVNVPNKTVITAVHGAELKENVFTKIDGAVIA